MAPPNRRGGADCRGGAREIYEIEKRAPCTPLHSAEKHNGNCINELEIRPNFN